MSCETYTPQDVYESEISRTLLAIAWRTNPESVDGVAGVKTVIPYWERPENEDCAGFVFGSEVDGKEATLHIMESWVRTDIPIPDAIAVYTSDGYPTHVGIVQPNGNVLSKWTTNLFESGHIYEHLPLSVPSDYGETVLFYTREQ